MPKILSRQLFIIFSILLIPTFGHADEYVNGYFKLDGTYVQGYYRSSPNNTVYDNFSHIGNVNPYTGKIGTNYYRNNSNTYYNFFYPSQPNPTIVSSQSYGWQSVNKSLSIPSRWGGVTNGTNSIVNYYALREVQKQQAINNCIYFCVSNGGQSNECPQACLTVANRYFSN